MPRAGGGPGGYGWNMSPIGSVLAWLEGSKAGEPVRSAGWGRSGRVLAQPVTAVQACALASAKPQITALSMARDRREMCLRLAEASVGRGSGLT